MNSTLLKMISLVSWEKSPHTQKLQEGEFYYWWKTIYLYFLNLNTYTSPEDANVEQKAISYFSPPPPPIASQSVVDLGSKYWPPPFLPLSGHCIPVSYSQYLQILFNHISQSLHCLPLFLIPFILVVNLIWHSFIIQPFSIFILTYSMEQSPSWEANWFCS